MIHRAIDDDGDIRFGQGVASYARDDQAIAVNIRTRLLSWAGDCFFALNEGIDWISRLDKGQEKNLEVEIQSNILQAYGVVGINSMTAALDRATRKITITADIQTIYSPSFQILVEQAIGATGE